jgi:hypothetical protein
MFSWIIQSWLKYFYIKCKLVIKRLFYVIYEVIFRYLYDYDILVIHKNWYQYILYKFNVINVLLMFKILKKEK